MMDDSKENTVHLDSPKDHPTAESPDVYHYDTEEDKREYVDWLKRIGAWDELTIEVQQRILSDEAEL